MMLTSKIKQCLHSMYPMRKELVPCLIGNPGIGKTQGIYEFADEIGVNVVTFILSNTVPSEVSGIRMPDRDSKKMEVFDDMRMASLKDGDILFFDEILEAPPALWSACLTLIQDRIMASGRKLPDVFIVAASNPVASPTIIPASTRDRFQFIKVEFDREQWMKWMEDKHGIRVTDSLANRIDVRPGDCSDYNIVTPRRVTKLLLWLQSIDDKDGRKEAADIVSDMVDGAFAQSLLSSLVAVHSPARQILEAVKANVSDYVAPSPIFDEWSNLPLDKLLLTMQESPWWPEIEKALSKTELMIEDEEELIRF